MQISRLRLKLKKNVILKTLLDQFMEKDTKFSFNV